MRVSNIEAGFLDAAVCPLPDDILREGGRGG